MEYNIPEMLTSRKVRDVGSIVAIALLGVFSFGLGRLSGLTENQVPVTLCTTEEALQSNTDVAAGVGYVLQNNSYIEPLKSNGVYIASKSGSVYHFPWCSGAQRIKEENKVWFESKEEAEAAGYRPANNCKGL